MAAKWRKANETRAIASGGSHTHPHTSVVGEQEHTGGTVR